MPRWAHGGDAPLSSEVREAAERRLTPWITKTNECWIWTGTMHPTGLTGPVTIHGVTDYVHYWMWRLAYPTLRRPARLNRRCEDLRCCNPAHRRLRGGHLLRLSEDDMTAIFEAHQQGVSQAALARKYGVSQQAISHHLCVRRRSLTSSTP